MVLRTGQQGVIWTGQQGTGGATDGSAGGGRRFYGRPSLDPMP